MSVHKLAKILNLIFPPLVVLLVASAVLWIWHPIGFKLFLSFLVLIIAVVLIYWIYCYEKNLTFSKKDMNDAYMTGISAGFDTSVEGSTQMWNKKFDEWFSKKYE